MELWSSPDKSMRRWQCQFLSGNNSSSQSLQTSSHLVKALMSDSKFEKGDIRLMWSEDWTQLICSSSIKSFALSERPTMLGKDRTCHSLSWFTSGMLCFSMRSDWCPGIDWCDLHTSLCKGHKQHFSSPLIFTHLIRRWRHSMQAIFVIDWWMEMLVEVDWRERWIVFFWIDVYQREKMKQWCEVISANVFRNNQPKSSAVDNNN